jgi:plasmid stabilization system protein ParE
MRLVLHPDVLSDVGSIMDHYASIGGRELAANFRRELGKSMSDATKRPESFSIRFRDLRRVNLSRFPYHFFFRILGHTVRRLVVRHNRKSPLTGIERQ